MSIRCENCGELVHAPNPNEPLRRLARDATDNEPKSFVITARDATGARLVHRCVVVDDHRRP
jgi:hypothetical protein